MIIVDTNVLVALTDRDDQHHSLCRTWLATTESPLLVPSTVLAEACYLIDRELGRATEATFLDDVGTTTVATLNRRDFDNLRPKHAAALDIVPVRR